MTRISIIMPVYNGAQRIKKSVNSILTQDFKDFELIIINDGSTDNTAEICNDLAKKDSRIKVYHIENHGASYARNLGILKSTAKYIGFVDSDDWVEPQMFGTLLNLMENNDVQLVCCNFFNDTNNGFSENKQSVTYQQLKTKEEIYGSLYYESGIGGYVWNKLFIKKYIKKPFDEKYAQCEDFLFVLHYINSIEKMIYTTQKMYHYIRESQIQDFRYTERSITLMDAYEDILSEYKKNADGFTSDIQKHVLKNYLNFRARYKIIGDNNSFLKVKIDTGIRKYILRVLFDHKIRMVEKINIISTYLFPKIVLKFKRKYMNFRHTKGQW